MIDVAKQFLDPHANILSFGAKRIELLRNFVRVGMSFGCVFQRGIFFLPQTLHQLDGLVDAIFEAAKGIRFLVESRHQLAVTSGAVGVTGAFWSAAFA